MNALAFGAGDSATWPACSGHVHDPRTVEMSDFDAWEETVSYWEILDAGTIDSVLFEMRHGSPDAAKAQLDEALRVEFGKQA